MTLGWFVQTKPPGFVSSLRFGGKSRCCPERTDGMVMEF
jgi:hypothetical protein